MQENNTFVYFLHKCSLWCRISDSPVFLLIVSSVFLISVNDDFFSDRLESLTLTSDHQHFLVDFDFVLVLLNFTL